MISVTAMPGRGFVYRVRCEPRRSSEVLDRLRDEGVRGARVVAYTGSYRAGHDGAHVIGWDWPDELDLGGLADLLLDEADE